MRGRTAIGERAQDRAADTLGIDADMIFEAFILNRHEGFVDEGTLDGTDRHKLTVDVLGTSQDGDLIAIRIVNAAGFAAALQLSGRNRVGRRDIADQHAAAQTDHQESHDNDQNQDKLQHTPDCQTDQTGDGNHVCGVSRLAVQPFAEFLLNHAARAAAWRWIGGLLVFDHEITPL